MIINMTALMDLMKDFVGIARLDVNKINSDANLDTVLIEEKCAMVSTTVHLKMMKIIASLRFKIL